MNLPRDVWRLVGYYAVSTLIDLETLVRSGVLVPHPKALVYATITCVDVHQAVRAMGASMLGHVRKLKLCETLSDACLRCLADCAPRLEELDLGMCRAHTQHIGRFHQLRKLTMTQCPKKLEPFVELLGEPLGEPFVEPVGEPVGELIQHPLRHLTLNGNRVGSEPDWCVKLECLTKLKSLSITRVHDFDNSRARAIGNMTGLKRLSIKGCPRLNNYSFLQGLHSLRSLQVEMSFDWSMLKHLRLHVFAAMEFLIRDLDHLSTQRGLQSLRLCTPLWDPGPKLSTLIADWPDLHTLDLGSCTHLSATRGLPVCPSVKCLKIDFCKLIDDDRLRALMFSFPNVQILSANFTRVSDAGVACVHKGVRGLSLRGCQITDAVLPLLRPMLFLTALDVAYSALRYVTVLPASLRTIDVTGCADSCIVSTHQLLRGGRVNILNSFSTQKF